MPRTIFENLIIQHYKENTFFENCPYAPIRFFEILYIENGKGSLVINGHSIPYTNNQLFIFVPNDKYTFKVESATTVSTIKFLNSFFVSSYVDGSQTEKKEWFKKIETILHSTNRTSNIELRSENEKNSILSLFSVICDEYNDSALKSDLILKNSLHSILHILSRNVGFVSLKSATSKIQEIVRHINYNIYNTEELSNKVLASEFNISENYIGQYFKKQMGISLKKYILNHKIKLAETRLKYTDLTLSEIASELGFTDSSHLDKTFLSYKGITPGTYRQGIQNM